MFGKIVFINAIPRSTNFEVEYGLPHDCHAIYTAPNVTIIVQENFREGSEKKPFIKFYGSYEVTTEVRKNGDKIKKITIFNKEKEEIPDEACVDTLLVIVKYGWFETTSKRVAGKTSHDGVFEMHEKETITVYKGEKYPHYTFRVGRDDKDSTDLSLKVAMVW